MAFTLVQSKNGSVGGANASSVTVTTTATGSGNLLVAFVTISGTNGVTITPPSGWTQVGTSQGTSFGSATFAMFYRANCPSGTTSHVFSFSSSVNGAVAFEEWSGVATSSPLDQFVAQQNAQSSSTPTGTTAALAATGELAIWGAGVGATNILTYSSVTNSYTWDSAAEGASSVATRAEANLFYNTSVGTAGTSSAATASGTGANGNTTILAVFKPATSGVALAGTFAGVGTLAGTLSLATALFGTLAGIGTLAGTLSIPPPALTITIGGTPIIFDEDTFQLSLKLDERWRFQFTVLDYAGTQQFSYRQQVVVTDATLGVLFAGFVADVKQDKTNTYSDTTIEHQIDCIDMRGLVDKRTSNWFYANQQAGVIAVHQVQKYLATEGVTAAAALRWDEQLTDWQAGTLTNTVATTNVYDSNPGDGDLELALAGTAVTKTESTTANWNAGTLTGLQAANNQLLLNSHSGLSFSASCASGFGNAFAYYKIWDGSYVIQSGDFLGYKMWVSSDSPQIMAGVDGVCTDGTTIRDFNVGGRLTDQNGLNAHPNTDLSSFANDQWYYRQIDLSAMAGKTLDFATVVFEGDSGGTYQAYFYDVQIENSSGVTQQNFYGDAGTFHSNAVSLNTLKKVSSNGYSSVMVKTLLVYESTGTRISPSTSIAATGIYRSSQINWAVTLPDTTALTMYTSIDDGGTWQQVTSLSAIANLLAGAALTSRTVMTRQVLSLTGKDPIATPQLRSVTWTVMPSYVATKSDTKSTFDTQANWNTGTLTNLTALAGGDLQITSDQRNWDDASVANQTIFGTGAAQGTFKRQASLTSNTSSDARSRCDFAGNWQNFTMSVDIQITSANIWSGLIYRTTGWQNTTDTYAYKCDVNINSINLNKGTNTGSGAGSRTSLGTAALSLTVGDWHTLTVVVNGSSHTVYLDGVQYIQVTDATWSATGNVGICLTNSSGSTTTAYFDNFGIMVTPGVVGGSPAPQWLSPSISLGSITVGNSIVFWDDSPEPNGSVVAVLASVNGGTFNACTNGGVIPGLTAGTVLTGGTVQYKVQIQSPIASITPLFHGLTSWVLSAYSSSGSRISPALSLAPVGSQVGTALVNWNANLPTNTGLTVQTSINGGSTYQTVAAPGNAISGITLQAALTDDGFTANTSANYTSTFGSGGSVAAWTWDTANSRLVASGGVTGLLLYSSVTATDVDILVDMDESDFGGICFRHVDATHYYILAVRDASSPGSGAPNSVQLYKANGGAEAAIGPTNPAIRFVRGIPYRVRVTMIGSVITVYFDGAQVATYTDGSPLGAGLCGLRNDTFAGASTSRYYQLRIQPLGQNVSALSLVTKVTLTSTDPTVTPQLLDMQAFVSSPAIGAGTLIPSASYNYTFIDKNLDDLAKQSNYGWFIDQFKALNFQGRQAVPSPWILSSNTLAQPSDLEADSNLLVEIAGDLYRNRQVLTGVIGTAGFTDSFIGDGTSTSFTLRYPVAPGTIPTITLNGQAQTVALQGASGAQWYYAVGSTTIAQDSSGTVLTNLDTLSISYTGTFTTEVVIDNTAAQTALAAVEGGSGIVEAVEDVSSLNMTLAAATTYANQLLTRYCITGRTLTYKTYRNGLAVGQIQSVLVPEEFLQDVQLLIRQIDVAMQTQPNKTVLYNYLVNATELPNQKSWSQLLASGLLD